MLVSEADLTNVCQNVRIQEGIFSFVVARIRDHALNSVDSIETTGIGTCLVVQWLRLSPPNAQGTGLSLVRELRSHMPRGVARNLKKTYIGTIS